MITIQAPTLTLAAKQAYLQLLASPANRSDRLILHEDAACIEIPDTSHVRPSFSIQNEQFVYDETYSNYVPSIDPALVQAEEQDYSRLLMASKELDIITDHLSRFPDSRRNLISCWSSTYLNPKVVGVCISQWYFRIYNGKLALHSHARANDAYRLLLLDMQLAVSVQHHIAQRIGVAPGRYAHFADSLHFYKQHRSEITVQTQYLQTSPYWSDNPDMIGGVR